MEVYRQHLEDLVVKYSEAQLLEVRDPIEEITRAYAGRLPVSMIEVWDRIGLGVFFDGFFQLCDPRSYSSIVEIVFEGDPDFLPDKTHVIGLSAFGHLLAWNESYRALNVDLVNGQLICRSFPEPKRGIDPSMSLLSQLLTSNYPASDIKDNMGKGMFSRARSRMGPVPYGSIYGFQPILAFGGPRDPDRLAICEATAHMSILAQAAPLKLMDYKTMQPQIIRMIGEGG